MTPERIEPKMPFIEPQDSTLAPLQQPGEPITGVEPERPPIGETIGSAFRLENTAGAVVRIFTDRRDGELDLDHNPLDIIGDDSVYTRDFLDRFAGSRNEQDTLRIRDQIDRELEDRKVIDMSGSAGVAVLLANGLLDPINLLPGGAIARSIKGGVSILRTAQNTAIAGGVAGAVAEGVLFSTQQTRTPDEVGTGIGVNAIFCGLVPGHASMSLSSKSQATGGRHV